MEPCGRCRYFDVQPWMRREFCTVLDDDGQAVLKGFCRRVAPPCQLVDVVQLATPSFARWPIVFANDWCGEFAPRAQREGQTATSV